MDKPHGRRLAIEEAQCDQAVQGSIQNGGEMARDKSKKFEVAPKSISAETGLGRPGRVREIRKETSEWEVRAALILLIYTRVRYSIYSQGGVLSNHAIQVAHLWRWIVC